MRRWAIWWVSTSETWQYNTLLKWFIDACWEVNVAAYATGLLLRSVNKPGTTASQAQGLASLALVQDLVAAV